MRSKCDNHYHYRYSPVNIESIFEIYNIYLLSIVMRFVILIYHQLLVQLYWIGRCSGFALRIKNFYDDVTIHREVATMRREYIFKRIFHTTTFGPVEIGNSFELHSWKRKWRRNYPEHYHLYEILCASLCIVIIPSLFTAIPSGRELVGTAKTRVGRYTYTRKATILIKGLLAGPCNFIRH